MRIAIPSEQREPRDDVGHSAIHYQMSSGSEPPVRCVMPMDQLFGDDAEDTQLLHAMAAYAENYLSSFKWCEAVEARYFGGGVGKIVAVFLFRIRPTRPDIDRWLWVIVGDIPPAYLVTDRAKAPSQALEAYISEMRRWVELARKSRSSPHVIPVNRPATPEEAKELAVRLDALEEMMVPRFRDEEIERA
ncbi:MAG TPA: hypothetical protein VEJ46_17335 [Candidatus Acidoferrum sp.]|nr:hypothetical protein [Candidatus Acidoferrum sp.]